MSLDCCLYCADECTCSDYTEILRQITTVTDEFILEQPLNSRELEIRVLKHKEVMKAALSEKRKHTAEASMDQEMKDTVDVRPVSDNVTKKRKIAIRDTMRPFCCKNLQHDIRASSSLEITHPAVASIITDFITALAAGHITIYDSQRDRLELTQTTVIKVNTRTKDHFDADTVLFAPTTREDAKYERLCRLDRPQDFPVLTEQSQMAYWCKEHRRAFRIGVVSVWWEPELARCASGNKAVDIALGILYERGLRMDSGSCGRVAL